MNGFCENMRIMFCRAQARWPRSVRLFLVASWICCFGIGSGCITSVCLKILGMRPYCPDDIGLSMDVQHNAAGTTKTLLISLRVPEGQVLASTEGPNVGLGCLDVSCFFKDESMISFKAPISAREQSNPHVLVYEMQLLESGANCDESVLLNRGITKVELEGELPFLFTNATDRIVEKKGAFKLQNCSYSSRALSD